MYHRVLMISICLCLLLAACGATPTPVEPAAPDVSVSPATVHEHFIAALQRNDRQAVLTLVGDIPSKDGLVGKWLGDATALQRTSGTIGPFTRVHLLPPTEQGQGQIAISVWQHETGADCYRAHLAQREAAWQVISWESMGLGKCPTS